MSIYYWFGLLRIKLLLVDEGVKSLIFMGGIGFIPLLIHILYQEEPERHTVWKGFIAGVTTTIIAILLRALLF